ncbi:MAG TPA: DNA polymerase IV [Lachnospiraceae bacterium]|nr:DNA polymerase IV [Lachnospiraceae bacterium]
MVIFHVDVNSAFLSWEAAYRINECLDPVDLRTIPAVIGGNEKDRHGIVLTKSVPAKAYGIKTGEPLTDARKKCPGLIVVPPNYPLYVECSRRLMRLLRKYSPCVEQYSIDEAFCDMTGTEGRYGTPVVFANELREEINQKFGFTVNIGVSSNKLLAKMAGELKKPNLTHSLFPQEIPQKLWPLPVEELFFVGHATKHKMQLLGIHTIGELAKTDPDILKAHLKSQGMVIWSFANGTDVSELVSEPPENKGCGNSTTVASDLTDMDTARHVLLSLCETVGTRLRADRMKACCLAVSITDYEFFHFSHQKMLPSPTDVTIELYRSAVRVFSEMWDGTPIRQLGVHTSRLTHEEAYQFNLFDRERHDRLMCADRAVDAIRSRMGEDSIFRACFLTGPTKNMAGGLDRTRRTGITEGIPDLFPNEKDPI